MKPKPVAYTPSLCSKVMTSRFVGIFLIALGASSLFAQVDRAELEGTVSDP